MRKGQDNMMPLLQCTFCGNKHLRKKELCPAWQKKCSKCHRQNHFAVCCPPDIRKRVNNVDQEEHSEYSGSDSEFLVNVVKQVSTMKQDKKSHSGPIYVEMIIVDTKQPVKLQVDCGAEIKVISKRYIPNVTLEESSMTLQMWNNMTTKTIGKTRLIVRNSENNKKYNVEFQVVKEERTPLIGRKAAEDMKLITVNYDNFKQVNSVSEKDILSEFSDVISVDDNSLGTLPGTVHFTTDVTVDSKVVSPKRVPVGLKEKLKVKLQNLVKNGVIQEVDEPTDWVSQMTTTLKKNNDIMICLDLAGTQ